MHHNTYKVLITRRSFEDIRKAVSKHFDVNITVEDIDRKILARACTPPSKKVNKKPKLRFGTYFFTRLENLQSIQLNIQDSRSKIRRECYGFRDKASGDRIYLRWDLDSIVIIRDSPGGFITGRRYLIPRCHHRGGKSWDLINVTIKKIMLARGITISKSEFKATKRDNRMKRNMVNVMIKKRVEYWKKKAASRVGKAKYAKAQKQICV